LAAEMREEEAAAEEAAGEDMYENTDEEEAG